MEKAGGRGIWFSRFCEHLLARQGRRLRLGTGASAELAEAVDITNVLTGTEQSYIIATSNVGIGQLQADGLAVLQFIHGRSCTILISFPY
jgi:hypothetical protein